MARLDEAHAVIGSEQDQEMRQLIYDAGRISAFVQDAAGRDITGDVVGIAIDPEPARVEFLERATSILQRVGGVRVIDHDRKTVLGGDRHGLHDVLADPRLGVLRGMPTRLFADTAEPRRAVLDEIATRSLAVEITVRGPQ